MYEATEENLTKAANSIHHAFSHYVECKDQKNIDGMCYWIKVYEQRIQFFCDKLDVSKEVLAKHLVLA